MLKKERQVYILKQLDIHNKVLSTDLSMAIGVSEDTIRRDLNELAEEGKIMKVHGGALSKSFHVSFQPSSSVYALDNKRTIARKAASLIQDGMFVLTTGGTSIIELARCLPPDLRATFLTGSLPAAIEYMQHPGIEIIIIGDKLSKSSQITVGGEAISQIKKIRANLCILGVNGLDPLHGLTDNDWEVVQVKKAIIEASQKVVCLSIAEKVNTFQPIQVCTLDKIDVLITELNPDDPLLDPYVEAGIEVL